MAASDSQEETNPVEAEPDEKSALVGFDLGGTKMLSHIYDADFNRLGRERKKTHGYRGPKAGVERIIEVIRLALDDADCSPKNLRGIGIGCPGPVSMDDGVLLGPPNLGWGVTKIAAPLKAEFDCPVFVVNDVDAGVFGEYRFGAAKKARCAVGVFPGTGIGGGAVYEGSIFRGAGASCMEIGHVQVDPEGPLCGCGQRGCLEAVASRLAVAANSAKAAYRGEAKHLLENAGTDLKEIRSGAIAEAFKHDRVIEDIVKEAARQIGLAVAGVVHLLGPDVVVLGGGLVEALPGPFLEIVSDVANGRVMPAYRKSFKVREAELGDDAGVLGAAAWAEKQLAE